MTRTRESRAVTTRNLIIPGIIVAALAGWGAYGYSALSSMQLEQQMDGQTAALQDYQAQFLTQRRKAEEGAREITRLQEQLASATGEIERLAARNKEIEADLATSQEQLASLQNLHAPPALGRAPALRGITPVPTRQDILAAQEALTRLGFGTLEADGVMGPSTREAIEKFQQVVGLTITGELHGLTLQSLMRSAKVVAAQSERADQAIQ